MPGPEPAVSSGIPGDRGTARLYALVARRRRRAVVFRRGPGRRVRLLLWDLATDAVLGGDWFGGRIYERRCDLSPDGDTLAYFAATYRPPLRSWTALSRPPALAPIALWPKGDGWGGGGLFAGPGLLELNHAPEADGSFPLADGFALPTDLAVRPMGPHAGGGEDASIEWRRLLRDGWALEWNVASRDGGKGSPYGFVFDPPRRSARPVGGGATLSVLLHALQERGGRWQVQTAVVERGSVRRDLGRVDWADADHTGDVLYAAGGCLHRIRAPDVLGNEAEPVADLNGRDPAPVAPLSER